MGVDKFFDNPGMRRFTDVVQTIQAVVAALSALVLVYLAIGHRGSVPIWLVVALLLGLSAIGLVYLRYLWRPTFYNIEEAHCELLIEKIGSHHRYTYTKEQLVRARRETRLIEFRAHWTGYGTRRPEINALHGHVLLDGDHPEEDFRVYRWVYPKHPVSRGQTIRVGIRQVHEDDQHPQQPYYRDGGSGYPARRLTVTTKFPLSQQPRKVEGRVWNSYRPTGKGRDVGSCSYSERVNRESGTVDYVIEVERPRMHYSYGIRWEWPG